MPCAGDSEPNDENVMSPKPLDSPSGAIPSGASTMNPAGADTSSEGDVCRTDVRVVLMLRVLVDAVETGVRFLVDGIGTSSAAGSAPVIIRSASSTVSSSFLSGVLLLERVGFDFVTSPSLSSLKLWMLLLALVRLDATGLGSSLRGAGFATRVVVDVILVLFGRGMFATDRD